MDFKVLKSLFGEFCFDDKNFKRDAMWLAESYANTPQKEEIKKLKQQLKKLSKGTPLAYIMGFVPFLNCKIFVNHKTLIPRPETEQLVDMLAKKYTNQKPKILDLCAGSGAIGISLQKQLGASVTCVDIDNSCIKMIKKNAKENNALISVIKSNMFQKITGAFDLIVSNPPYIASDDIKTLDKSVWCFEPKLALDGGKDGLNYYRIIAEKAPAFLSKNGMLALEIGFNQAKDIKEMLKENFKNIKIIKDYFKLNRFILAERR